MKNIFTVFSYTFKIAAKKRAFIITTAVIMAIVLALCFVPQILNAFTGGNPDSITDGVFYTCYYIDEDGLIPYGEIALYKVMTNTFFPVGHIEKLEEYRAEINNDATVSVIIVENVEGKPHIKVIARDFMSNMSTNTKTVVEVLSREYISKTMAEHGIPPEFVDFSQSKIPLHLNPRKISRYQAIQWAFCSSLSCSLRSIITATALPRPSRAKNPLELWKLLSFPLHREISLSENASAWAHSVFANSAGSCFSP